MFNLNKSATLIRSILASPGVAEVKALPKTMGIAAKEGFLGAFSIANDITFGLPKHIQNYFRAAPAMFEDPVIAFKQRTEVLIAQAEHPTKSWTAAHAKLSKKLPSGEQGFKR